MAALATLQLVMAMQCEANSEKENFLTSASVYNIKPAAEKLYSPAAMFKKVSCTPRENACAPQCPVAIWHAKTQRIYFSWKKQTNDCNRIFQPEFTAVFLYTFYEYMAPRDSYRSIEDKIVLKYASTSPGSSVRMSRPINNVFPKRGNEFLPNEKYYVGVMYG